MSALWGLLAEPSVLAALISVFAGSGAGVAASFASRRLTRDADAQLHVDERAASRAWRAIVTELRDQLDDLRGQLEESGRRSEALERRNDVSERRLTECETDRADLRRRLAELS